MKNHSRINTVVSSATGHIITTASRFIQFYNAPINRDMVIVEPFKYLPDHPKAYLFVVMHFADGKFIFATYRGNPRDFVPAPMHQRVNVKEHEGFSFNPKDHHNTLWNYHVTQRIRSQHFMITNGNDNHSERPVSVTIIPFTKRDDLDAYAEKYALDIDLTNNLSCLNHRSYEWDRNRAISAADREDRRIQRFVDRNKARRKADAQAKQKVALGEVADDKNKYIIAQFRNGEWQTHTGTKAQLMKRFKFTVADINTILKGGKVRGWVNAEIIVRDEFIKRRAGGAE